MSDILKKAFAYYPLPAPTVRWPVVRYERTVIGAPLAKPIVIPARVRTFNEDGELVSVRLAETEEDFRLPTSPAFPEEG